MTARRLVRRVCDHGALWGTASLLTVPVLAFGGVHDWARSLVEVVAASLGAVWSIRLLADTRTEARGTGFGSPRPWAALLAALLLLSVVPLPPTVLRFVAPHAYEITAQALPGWPDRAPFAESLAAVELPPVVLGFGPFPTSWRPVALVPYDTAMTLWTAAAYAVAGSVVAFYPWRASGIPAMTHLATVLITVGAFEALYGLLLQSGGTRQIYWFECTSDCVGTYTNRDHYAGLIEMALPLALARAASWLWLARRNRPQARRAVNLRAKVAAYRDALAEPAVAQALCIGGVAILLFAALAVSASRSALAATLISLAIMTLVPPGNRRRVGFARRHIAAAAALAIVAGLWVTFPRVSERFTRSEAWSDLRPAMWADTFAMARDFPLLGVGLGNFASAFELYRARTSEHWEFGISHAHNDYLEWLSEVGVPATLVSLGLLISFGRRVAQTVRHDPQATPEAFTRWGLAAGALVMVLHSWTDFNLHVPANALVFTVLLGGLVRLSRLPAAPVRRRRLIPTVGLVLSAIAIVMVWQRWTGEAAFRRVHPDFALRSLLALPAELSDSAALALLQRAGAQIPAAPQVQGALGRALLDQGLAPETDEAAADGALDAAVNALVRSLWGAPLSATTMLHLVEAVDPIYEPDTEADALYALVSRAGALMPYSAGLQLDVAQWHLNRWALLGPHERKDAARQIEAALARAARDSELQAHREAIRAAYERVA